MAPRRPGSLERRVEARVQLLARHAMPAELSAAEQENRDLVSVERLKLAVLSDVELRHSEPALLGDGLDDREHLFAKAAARLRQEREPLRLGR